MSPSESSQVRCLGQFGGSIWATVAALSAYVAEWLFLLILGGWRKLRELYQASMYWLGRRLERWSNVLRRLRRTRR